MATNNAQNPAQKPGRAEARQTVTPELVKMLAASHNQSDKMSSAFGLDPVDYHAIREATEEQMGRSARALQPTVNETAMRIHLQRIVGAFVGSARRCRVLQHQGHTGPRPYLQARQRRAR